jgi:CheY-like chemotaxis protein
LAKTILVAEDRDASRELIRTVLSAAGYDVVEAVDGREAIEKADRTHADLVILDLYMPNVDGYGVLRHLRAAEKYRNTPIVALTASAMSGDKQRAIESGFTAYISKPVKMTELRREIGRLLESVREQTTNQPS